MTARKPVGLTIENAVGNGTPATPDLIKVQTAILLSNATVLGAVTEFRTGIDDRLTRKFGEITTQIGALDVKLDGVCLQVGDLEEARRLTAALAGQADKIAVAADVVAVKANAIAVQHSLSTNQRMAIIVSAIAACGGVIIGLLNFLAGH
jgi:hypothetical protein